MPEAIQADELDKISVSTGRLSENIVHFARVLRAAGLPVGPDRVVVALQALERAGVEQRERVHAALSAVLIDRHEHQALFDSAFNAFWRDPKLFERLMYLTLPKIQGRGSMEREKRSQRLQDALAGTPEPPVKLPEATPGEDEIALETTLTYSDAFIDSKSARCRRCERFSRSIEPRP